MTPTSSRRRRPRVVAVPIDSDPDTPDRARENPAAPETPEEADQIVDRISAQANDSE
jgi:hypothetical protein